MLYRPPRSWESVSVGGGELLDELLRGALVVIVGGPVSYTHLYDISRPVGERVTSMRVNGQDVREEDTFTICLNSYRASGTGGYDFCLLYTSAPPCRHRETFARGPFRSTKRGVALWRRVWYSG